MLKETNKDMEDAPAVMDQVYDALATSDEVMDAFQPVDILSGADVEELDKELEALAKEETQTSPTFDAAHTISPKPPPSNPDGTPMGVIAAMPDVPSHTPRGAMENPQRTALPAP